MKPEIVTIRRSSPPPVETSDPRRPRPYALECLRQCLQVWRRNPSAHVQFVYQERPRLLRDLEARQAWVEASIRASRRLEHQRVMDDLANRREARLRPTLRELHERLRRATR